MPNTKVVKDIVHSISTSMINFMFSLVEHASKRTFLAFPGKQNPVSQILDYETKPMFTGLFLLSRHLCIQSIKMRFLIKLVFLSKPINRISVSRECISQNRDILSK